MILILRFIGVVNAAIWFGAAAFFTFAVAPAFFTPEMKSRLGDFYTGWIAQKVLDRYFLLHYWCGGIALVHLLAEWVYLGKALSRFLLWLLIGTLGLSLIGGLGLTPKLKRLHLIKYARAESFTDTQRTQAARSFSRWHGVSSGMNLLILCGLAVYFWRTVHSNDGPRFVSANKFRS